MKAKELIQILQKINKPEAEIVYADDMGYGYYETNEVELKKAKEVSKTYKIDNQISFVSSSKGNIDIIEIKAKFVEED